jgi:hypothetical protein
MLLLFRSPFSSAPQTNCGTHRTRRRSASVTMMPIASAMLTLNTRLTLKIDARLKLSASAISKLNAMPMPKLNATATRRLVATRRPKLNARLRLKRDATMKPNCCVRASPRSHSTLKARNPIAPPFVRLVHVDPDVVIVDGNHVFFL